MQLNDTVKLAQEISKEMRTIFKDKIDATQIYDVNDDINHRAFKIKFIAYDYFATVYKGNIIKNLIMDCQSYTKYRPNETTGGIFVSWRRKEELPTGA